MSEDGPVEDGPVKDHPAGPDFGSQTDPLLRIAAVMLIAVLPIFCLWAGAGILVPVAEAVLVLILGSGRHSYDRCAGHPTQRPPWQRGPWSLTGYRCAARSAQPDRRVRGTT